MTKIMFKWVRCGIDDSTLMPKALVVADYGYGAPKNVGTVTRERTEFVAKLFLGDDAMVFTGTLATPLKLDIAEALDKFNNEMVTVKSLMTGKEVEIRRCDEGGPCDPSTERYHSM